MGSPVPDASPHRPCWARSEFRIGNDAGSVRVGAGAAGVELEVGAPAAVVLPGGGVRNARCRA